MLWVETCTKQFTQIFSKLEQLLTELLGGTEVWCIEIPAQLKENWEICHSLPSKSYYGSTFKENDDGSFSHASPRLGNDNDPTSDLNVMMSGDVSLCKLNLDQIAITAV